MSADREIYIQVNIDDNWYTVFTSGAYGKLAQVMDLPEAMQEYSNEITKQIEDSINREVCELYWQRWNYVQDFLNVVRESEIYKTKPEYVPSDEDENMEAFLNEISIETDKEFKSTIQLIEMMFALIPREKAKIIYIMSY